MLGELETHVKLMLKIYFRPFQNRGPLLCKCVNSEKMIAAGPYFRVI